MALTPNLGLTLPTVGANRDTWGGILNNDLTMLDNFVGMAMPIGAVLDFGGPTAPDGWLICDGRLISRTTYSALFAVIQTYWGAGDGSTTFALPPTPGRASVGPGTVTDTNGTTQAFTFGQRLGAVSYTIAKGNLPNYAMTSDAVGPHSHTGSTTVVGDHLHTASADTQGDHQHTVAQSTAPGPGAVAVGAVSYGGPSLTSFNGLHTHNITVNGGGAHSHFIAADGSHTHSIMLGGSGTKLGVVQPVVVMTKIIYAGSQASLAVLGAASPAMRRRLSSPLRGSH